MTWPQPGRAEGTIAGICPSSIPLFVGLEHARIVVGERDDECWVGGMETRNEILEFPDSALHPMMWPSGRTYYSMWVAGADDLVSALPLAAKDRHEWPEHLAATVAVLTDRKIRLDTAMMLVDRKPVDLERVEAPTVAREVWLLGTWTLTLPTALAEASRA